MANHSNDCSAALQERIQAAAATGQPLFVRGNGSKAFYADAAEAEPLAVAEHRGVVAYEPTELVLTARAGTPLAAIEELLAQHGQMLPFEPPHFAGEPSFGGMVAAGFSGPRRFAMGTVRDAVLGVECLNGRGERQRFGGVVMKNVAGYDVSRLMVSSFGNLACLLEVSVKVLPVPEQEQTHVLALEYAAGLELLQRLTANAVPVSATAYLDGQLYLRLSGPERVLAAAGRELGGEKLEAAGSFWRDLRDHRLPFFQSQQSLWRISLPPHTELAAVNAHGLSECGGQIVWLHADTALEELLPQVRTLGGHAHLFHAGPAASTVPPPPRSPVLDQLFARVKQAFDPKGIFTSTRRYGDS